jgi:hypothetical protein
MPSLKSVFEVHALPGVPVWVLAWALSIIEDSKRREKERRRRIERFRQAELLRKGARPRPF